MTKSLNLKHKSHSQHHQLHPPREQSVIKVKSANMDPASQTRLPSTSLLDASKLKDFDAMANAQLIHEQESRAHCKEKSSRPTDLTQHFAKQNERRKLTKFISERPLPKEPIPWKTSAPFSHREMKPGTTRHTELIRGELQIEEARTDFELRYIIDHSLPNDEIWPPNTLAQQEEEFPKPRYDPQWKSDIYMKRELEDFILDEDIPTVSRLEALIDRLFLCHHVYSRFDLVEKGLAMCHELKFRIQGDADWGKVCSLEYALKKRQYPPWVEIGCEEFSKDKYDPRTWKPAFDIELAGFIKAQLAEQMHYEGYDIDREFSRIFGMESSERVLRGESPVRWAGYDPNRPVDWGYYRVRSTANGFINGHAEEDEEDEATEVDEEEHEPEEAEDKGDDLDEEEEQWDEEEIENDVGEDQSDDGLEEISAEAFREASVAREASSDIEITGTQGFDDQQSTINEYTEDDEESRMSRTDQDVEVESEADIDDARQYERESDVFTEQSADAEEETEVEMEDDEPPYEETGDPSTADSDELEILEEHYHVDQTSKLRSLPDLPADMAEETHRLEDYDNESEGMEDETIIAARAEESADQASYQAREGRVDQVEAELEEKGDDVAEDAEMDIQHDLPQIPQITQLRAHTLASDVSSPLSSLDDEEVTMTGLSGSAFTLPITNVATRALERAGAAPSIKNSDTSGLSSPPSSMSSSTHEDEVVAERQAVETKVESFSTNLRRSLRVAQGVQQRAAVEIDPVLLGAIASKDLSKQMGDTTIADHADVVTQTQSSMKEEIVVKSDDIMDTAQQAVTIDDGDDEDAG